MGGMSGEQIGQILGMIGGSVVAPGAGTAIGGSLGGAVGGAIDPQTGEPIQPQQGPPPSDPAARQDASSAQLQANAAQAQPQTDPNAQILQLLLMLANQGTRT